jgi:HAD superfamily hydrolase (TIGR01509 family)
VDRLTDRVMEQIQTSVIWRPGALELLSEVRNAGIPTALVTMSIHRMARHVASFMPAESFPFGAFDHIVAGDTVTHSKPHPEPYLRGAELLGVDVADCVVIEDSTTGLASAVASGALAIGVPLHSPLEHGRGYTIWPTLTGRTVADISELIASTRTDAA